MSTNLIDALTALTGPSREVDARIHYALFPDTEVLLDPGDMHTKRPGRRGPLSEMPIDGWADYDAICHHIGADRYTASLDAAAALVERVLPGWTWRVATCHVSDDAWVIPDFNHPVHGERLMREFGQVEGDPSAYWQEITDVDLRPSGRPAIALCIALIRALEARDGTE